MTEIRERSVLVSGPGGPAELPADQVFLLTGYHPDTSLLAKAGVRVDAETLVPVHDPASLETNIPGLFLAGALVSGKQTSRIFIENGRFHGEAIVGAITGRALAARG